MQHYDNLLNLSCDTTIATEKDGYYAFKETVFYGEKGGMPGDKGTINGLEVIDLKWEDDILYHKVDGILENPIHMEVDKEIIHHRPTITRKRTMRTQHIMQTKG